MHTPTSAAAHPARPDAAPHDDDALFRAITWRLTPLLFVGYVFN